jgi:hypothetical protein
VVVIGVVVVLILVLTGGSDTSSPQGIADSIVKAINDKDANAAKGLYCDAGSVGKSGGVDISDIPKDYKVSAKAGKTDEKGDTGSVQVFITLTQAGKTQDVTINFNIKKKDSKWCISGASLGGGSTGGTGGP